MKNIFRSKISRALFFEDLKKILVPVVSISLIFFVLLSLKGDFRAKAELIEDSSIGELAENSSAEYSYSNEAAFILDTHGLASSDYGGTATGKMISLNGGEISADAQSLDGKTTVPAKITTSDTERDKYKVSFDHEGDIKPGKYKLQVSINDGAEVQNLEKDFSWGVLALNLDQSTYKNGEKANIGVGVLDDNGKTVCDAKLELRIENQELGISETLSTTDGRIKISDTCANGNVTNIPDYSTLYTPKENGKYEIELRAETANGLRITEQSFEVLENPDFVTKRHDTSMRIYPPSPYTVNIEVLANKDLSGGIKEKVPTSFEISNISSAGQIIEKNETIQTITWPANLKAGESINLSYEYDAPDISPEFYRLGPLEIWQPTINIDGNQEGAVEHSIVFTEPRPWQIAADTLHPNQNPTSYTSTTGFNGNFTNPTEAYTQNNTYASVASSKNNEYATNYGGFSFSGIPDGSIINSITIHIDQKVSASGWSTGEWRSSIWADITTGNALTPGVIGAIGPNLQYTHPTTDTSDTDWNFPLTGTPPTLAELKGANFGIRAQVAHGTSKTGYTAYIDEIYIVVDYTAPATISIGGTVYGTDETTPVATGPLVRVKVNGLGDYSANANGSGVYNIASVPTATAGTAVTIYLDTGGGITGATFTVATGSSMANIHIYQDRASTRCDNSCSLTNANINQWDKSDDSDIHAEGSTGTVDNDWKLRVSANTYAPAGAVTMSTGGGSGYSGDLEIISGATLNMGANALSISGNYTNGGTATLSSNTTSFTKTSGTQTLISGGTGAGKLFNNLTKSGAGTMQLSTNALQVDGTLTVSAGTMQLSTLSISANGATSITGILDDNSNTGTNLFVGLITINAGGSWTSTGNSAYEIRGGITNEQTFTGGIGTYTLTTNSQNISGGQAMAFGGAVAISGAITITNQNTSTVTITGNLDGDNTSSTWTNSTNSSLLVAGWVFTGAGVLDATANPNTVTYNNTSSDRTIAGTTYYNLTIDTSTKTAALGFTTTVNGTLNVVSGIFNLSLQIFTCNGPSFITGTINDNYVQGTNLFVGLITINAGGSWTSTGNSDYEIRGGITNNQTFTAGSGVYTFTTNAQALTGTISISNVTVTGVTLTNNNTLTVGTALSGTGGLTQASNAVLNVGGTSGITALTATASPNTVNYTASGGGQTVKSATYHILTVQNTSGTDTAGGALTVNSGLTTTSGGTLAMSTYQLLGAFTPTNNGTITTSSTADPAIPTGKDWTGTTGLVQFAKTDGGQFVPAGTYKTLTFSNSSNTDTARGAITTTTLNTSASGTLDMATYTLTVTTPNNSGTIRTQCTTNPPITAGLAWGGTVQYDAASGGQTIASGTYGILTLSNSTGTETAGNNLTATTLNISNAGAILNMVTYALTVTTPNNSGTIRTQNTSGTPLSTGLTWGGTVTYDSTVAGQTVVNGTYNNLTIDKTAQTSTLGGDVNVNADLTVTSGILSGTNNLTVKGEASGGGTITLTGSSNFIHQIGSAKSFGSSSNANDWTFNNLNFENSSAGDLAVTTRSGGSGKIIVGDTLTIGNAGDSNITTLTNVDNDRILDIASVAITTKGALIASDSVGMTVSGSWTNSGTFTSSDGTITFDDTVGGKTLSGTMTGGSAFGAITFDGVSGGWSINSALRATGNFNLTNGSLTQGADIDLTFLGDVTFAEGTSFTKASGAGLFIMDGDDLTESYEDQHGTKIDIGNVQIGLSPGTTKLKSDMSASSLTVSTGDTFETHGWDVTLSDYFDCQGTGTFNLTDGPPSAAGDGTIVSVGGNYTMSASGTFTPSTDSLVTFTGNASADQTLTTGDKPFYAVTLNNTQGTYDDIDVSGILDIDGTLTITDGNLDLSLNDPAVNLAGNVSIASAGIWTKQDTGTPLVTFNGGSTTFADSSSGGPYDIGLVTIGPSTTTTLTTNTNMKLTDITIGADDTLDISGDTLYVDGNYVNSNTLTATSSTVDFTKSSSTQTLNSGGVGAGKIFNNLTHSGAGTLQLDTSAINIDGVFTNSNGTFDANDLNMNVADDFLVSGGSFSADVAPGATTQTVTFDGTNEATVSGSNTFYNLTMDTNADGAKTIKFTASSFQAISNTWTLDGDVGKILTLNSTVNDTAWEFIIPSDINPSGDYITVRDSQNNTNAYRITAGSDCVDSGNNDPGWIFITNNPPNDPASLTQKDDLDASISESAWTNSNTPKLGFTITDDDPGDTVKYEIQVATDSGFISLELDYTHGSLEASGTTFEFIVGTYGGGSCSGTCPANLSDLAGGYWWRVKAIDNSAAESSYVEFGVAGTMDFKVDATAPTGGTVKDGTDDTDDDYNGGSLSALSGYWAASEPTFDLSGKSATNVYQYAIGTTVGGNEIKDWTYTGTSGTDAYIDATGLTLRTGQTYYVSIEATDAAGNTTSAITSNGIAVAPTLTFSYFSGGAITFDDLNSGNSWTDSAKSTVLRTSTNAYGGYVVKARAIDKLRSSISAYFDHFRSGGTVPNSAPEVWTGTGFGYTTSDDNLSGGTSDRFTSGGPKYAGWVETGPGDPVADNPNPTHVQITDQDFTITYRVTGDAMTPAGAYSTTIVYTCIPQY
jgi:hypothetical protein